MRSSKPGKTTSKSTNGKRPNDPIDRLIIEDGLRIKDVYVRKDLDLLLLVLSNGMVLRSELSSHVRLRAAKQSALEKWNLIAGGRGVQWEALDEDLSLRGFIHETSLRSAIADLISRKGAAVV